MSSTAALRIIVTKLRRADHGEWEARVSLDGSTREVTRRLGSWMFKNGVDEDGRERFGDMPAWLAEELQARLPAAERKVRGKPRAPKT